MPYEDDSDTDTHTTDYDSDSVSSLPSAVIYISSDSDVNIDGSDSETFPSDTNSSDSRSMMSDSSDLSGDSVPDDVVVEEVSMELANSSSDSDEDLDVSEVVVSINTRPRTRAVARRTLNVPHSVRTPSPPPLLIEIPVESAAEPAPQEPQPSTSSAEPEKKETANPLKRPAPDTGNFVAKAMDSESDDEDQRCPICLESWSGTGEHRLCSLSCGHLFGKSCIERWMKKGTQRKRCPQCNKTCKKSDIRPLFATAIKVKETSEEEKLQQLLQAALKEKKDLELKLMRTELKMAEFQKQKQVESVAATALVTISTGGVTSTSTVNVRPGSNKLIFQVVKELSVGEKGGGRVMCFSPWATQLTASRASKLSGFGVMQMQCERNFFLQSMESIHSKMIRDMAYFPTSNNSLLLTASLDRTAKLIDYRCNLVAQTYRAAAPLWSCCWDTTGSPRNECQLVTLGMTSGTVARYDMRMVTTEPVMTLGKREDQSPVSSIVALPPGCCPSLTRGGLLVAQLTSCRLYIGEKDEEGTLMPFESPFLCVRAEPTSGHLLVSTRAHNNKPTMHSVMTFSQNRDVDPTQLFQRVVTLQGANRQTLMTRPCIASSNQNDLIVAANQEESRIVRLWSIATGARIASLPVSDDALDICNFSVNNNNFFALLMEKKIVIYNYHM